MGTGNGEEGIEMGSGNQNEGWEMGTRNGKKECEQGMGIGKGEQGIGKLSRQTWKYTCMRYNIHRDPKSSPQLHAFFEGLAYTQAISLGR